jgi:hypothetical protein
LIPASTLASLLLSPSSSWTFTFLIQCTSWDQECKRPIRGRTEQKRSQCTSWY